MIEKPYAEYNITATLKRSLQIRNPYGKIAYDTTGIRVINMELYGNFEENELREMLRNMVN